MAYFKNEYEIVHGACPDDDFEFIEVGDCETQEDFELFATAELTEELERLQESSDSHDSDKAEIIVDILRARGCNIKPNSIEDCVCEWELEEYYTAQELEKHKNDIYFQAGGAAMQLGQYLTEPNVAADGTTIAKVEKKIAELYKRFNMVYEVWRNKAIEETAHGNLLAV